MKLKSTTVVIKWKKVKNKIIMKESQTMKEIRVNGQLFVDWLDLKISKELSEVWKS